MDKNTTNERAEMLKKLHKLDSEILLDIMANVMGKHYYIGFIDSLCEVHNKISKTAINLLYAYTDDCAPYIWRKIEEDVIFNMAEKYNVHCRLTDENIKFVIGMTVAEKLGIKEEEFDF